MRKVIWTMVGSLVLFGSATAQVLNEETIHAELAAAVAAGATEYVIPNGTVNLTRTLRILPSAENFTLRGSGNTLIRRASATDFPLLQIGDGRPLAFSNSSWSPFTRTSLTSVAEGAVQVTWNGGATPTPGIYGLIGTDPTEDRVVHPNDATFEYWFKREIVRVVRVEGNTIFLDSPTGRSYSRAELRRLEAPGAPVSARNVAKNVSIQNLNFNGLSTVNGVRTQKVIVAGLVQGLEIRNVDVREFFNSAMSIMMSEGVNISNVDIRDGNTSGFGYGIEFAASRFLTVRDSFFANHRWGVVFTSGCMDALVEDCDYANGPSGGFDGGHGTGERRITYRRTRGPVFSIANPTFLRGAHDVRLENCTAYSQINVFGGTTRIVIDGKHPDERITTPIIQFFAEQYPTTGHSFPIDVTMRNGVSERSTGDGTNMQLVSVTGAPRALGTLLIQNWSFRNNVPNVGRAMGISFTSVPTNVTIENSTFDNRANPVAEPLSFGPVVGTGRWNVSLRNSRFIHANLRAVAFITGAQGQITQSGNQINGQTISDQNITGIGLLTRN